MGSRPPAIDALMIFAFLALVAGSLSFAGCAPQRVAFTQGIRTQYALGSEELKNLQYYVSGDITLQRDFRREEGEISKGHKLVTKEGGHLEEVVIPAGTPGIATEVGETSLAVSFEPGSSLMFGSPPNGPGPGTEVQAVRQAMDRLLRGDPLRRQDLLRCGREWPGVP